MKCVAALLAAASPAAGLSLSNMKLSTPSELTGAWAPEDLKVSSGRTLFYANKCMVNFVQDVQKYTNASSVADYGAGTGVYAKELVKRGVQSVHCYDGNPAIVGTSGGLCSQAELSSPDLDVKPVDVLYSFEVGEHVPKAREAGFLENIRRGSKKVVLLSWAVPGQVGDGHVNCQPNEYIIDRMTEKGFRFLPNVTSNMRAQLTNNYWCAHQINSNNFRNTLMVFQKLEDKL